MVKKAVSALCPHGFVLAENICGPCSEGRPNDLRISDDALKTLSRHSNFCADEQHAFLELIAARARLLASAAIVSRLCGAIEDYLDGETQGNVAGLRQAVAVAERARS